MELMNEMVKAKQAGASVSPEWKEVLRIYSLMLAPVTPHLAEELWMKLGKPYSIHQQSWPKVDLAAAAEEEITLVVQVNGKLRDRITVSVNITDDEAKKKALESEPVQKLLDGKGSQAGNRCTQTIGEYCDIRVDYMELCEIKKAGLILLFCLLTEFAIMMISVHRRS